MNLYILPQQHVTNSCCCSFTRRHFLLPVISRRSIHHLQLTTLDRPPKNRPMKSSLIPTESIHLQPSPSRKRFRSTQGPVTPHRHSHQPFFFFLLLPLFAILPSGIIGLFPESSRSKINFSNKLNVN